MVKYAKDRRKYYDKQAFESKRNLRKTGITLEGENMIRLAVIGIGRMGSRHARNIAGGVVKGAKLIAVCDTDKKVLAKFAASIKFPDIRISSNCSIRKNRTAS